MNKKYVVIIIGIAIVIGVVALSSSGYTPSYKTTIGGQNVSTISANHTAAVPHRTFTVSLNESVGMTTK